MLTAEDIVKIDGMIDEISDLLDMDVDEEIQEIILYRLQEIIDYLTH